MFYIVQIINKSYLIPFACNVSFPAKKIPKNCLILAVYFYFPVNPGYHAIKWHSKFNEVSRNVFKNTIEVFLIKNKTFSTIII